ncbi:hypothetical protein C8J57DRAFT_1542179 [Mycena rebaudengoi]|nr:hypothetical protein C8J57DRAFT_1542179 [Mycena rebaudengoi]
MTSAPHFAPCVRFWEGANYEMRRRWAGDGFDPESSNLDELEDSAINYEHAIKVENAQKHTNERNNGQGSGKQGCPKQGPSKEKHHGPPKQEGGSPNRKDGKGKQNNKDRNGFAGKGKPKNAGGQKPRKLTKEEMNEYHAQNKCFSCGTVGHLSKDCPDNNELNPKNNKISSASISFNRVEELRSLKDAQLLGVFSLTIEPMERTAEHMRAIDEVLVAKMYSELRAAVPFQFDYFSDPDDNISKTTRLSLASYIFRHPSQQITKAQSEYRFAPGPSPTLIDFFSQELT